MDDTTYSRRELIRELLRRLNPLSDSARRARDADVPYVSYTFTPEKSVDANAKEEAG